MIAKKQFFALSLLSVAGIQASTAPAFNSALSLNAPTIQNEGSVAFVSLNGAVLNSAPGKAAAEKVQKEAIRMQKTLESMKAEGEKYAQEVNAKKSAMNESAQLEANKKLAKMQHDLEFKNAEFKQDFEVIQNNAFAELSTVAQEAAENLRLKLKVDRVADLETGRTLAVDPKLDRTNDFVVAINDVSKKNTALAQTTKKEATDAVKVAQTAKKSTLPS